MREVIILNKVVFDNGLTLFYKQLSGTHSISFDLFVKAGVRYEKIKQNGISNLLGNLHYRGINGFEQKQLFYKMESIGSSLEIFTYKDFIRFSMKIHPKYYVECTEIFKSIFNTYYWDEELLEKEKKTILEQIEEENQYVNIDKISSTKIYGNSPLSWPIKGSYETINNIQVKHIVDFKKQIFNKDGLILCVSGPINEKHLAFIKRVFSEVVLSERVIKSKNIIPSDFRKRKRNIFWVSYNWDYIDVDISFDVPFVKKDAKYLDILNSILGEGIGSKLQAVLREEFAIASNVKSFIEKYDDLNVLHIQYSVEKNNFVLCFQQVINLLKQIKTNIKNSDIETSLPFYRENLEFLFDDPKKYNFYNAYNMFILGNDNELVGMVESTELMQLANKIFLPSNACVVCLGDGTGIDRHKIQGILNELINTGDINTGDGSVIDAE